MLALLRPIRWLRCSPTVTAAMLLTLVACVGAGVWADMETVDEVAESLTYNQRNITVQIYAGQVLTVLSLLCLTVQVSLVALLNVGAWGGSLAGPANNIHQGPNRAAAAPRQGESDKQEGNGAPGRGVAALLCKWHWAAAEARCPGAGVGGGEGPLPPSAEPPPGGLWAVDAPRHGPLPVGAAAGAYRVGLHPHAALVRHSGLRSPGGL
mmetsp:Transcript_364/g.1126  ORF Transcript_364/g.1126 Transcript_364/m.1126 type:complete len:209 (+) Transcript_364:1631-2257(+)